jgi:hypothetical protein
MFTSEPQVIFIASRPNFEQGGHERCGFFRRCVIAGIESGPYSTRLDSSLSMSGLDIPPCEP